MKRDHVEDSLSDEEDFEILNNYYDGGFLIELDSLFRKYWDYIISLITLYTLMVAPFRLSFKDLDYAMVDYFEMAMDCIFIIDIILQFFIPYYNAEEDLIKNKYLIAKNYILGWFFLDILASVPGSMISFFLFENDELLLQESQLLSYANTNSSNNIAKINKVTKITKLYRILKFTKLSKIIKLSNNRNKSVHANNIPSLEDLNVSSSIQRLVNFFLVFILVTHIVTCVWIFIGSNDYPNWISRVALTDADSGTLYISSLYFHWTTIFTIGYGDITSSNTAERLYNCTLMFFGVLIYSFAVSSLGTIVSSYDSLTIKFMKNMEQLSEISARYNVPQKFNEKVYKYLRYDYKFNKSEKFAFINELPIRLKNSLLMDMYREVIRNFKFLKENSQEFTSKVVFMMKPLRMHLKEYIITEGEFLEEVIFVRRGHLTIHLGKNYNEHKIMEIRKNEHFGDILVLSNLRSPVTIKVGTKICDLLIIKKQDLLEIAADFPESIEEIFLVSSFNYSSLMELIDLKKKKFDTENEKIKNRKLEFLNFLTLKNSNLVENINVIEENNRVVQTLTKQIENQNREDKIDNMDDFLNSMNYKKNKGEKNSIIKSNNISYSDKGISAQTLSRNYQDERTASKINENNFNNYNYNNEFSSISEIYKKQSKIFSSEKTFPKLDTDSFAINKINNFNFTNTLINSNNTNKKCSSIILKSNNNDNNICDLNSNDKNKNYSNSRNNICLQNNCLKNNNNNNFNLYQDNFVDSQISHIVHINSNAQIFNKLSEINQNIFNKNKTSNHNITSSNNLINGDKYSSLSNFNSKKLSGEINTYFNNWEKSVNNNQISQSPTKELFISNIKNDDNKKNPIININNNKNPPPIKLDLTNHIPDEDICDKNNQLEEISHKNHSSLKIIGNLLNKSSIFRNNYIINDEKDDLYVNNSSVNQNQYIENNKLNGENDYAYKETNFANQIKEYPSNKIKEINNFIKSSFSESNIDNINKNDSNKNNGKKNQKNPQCFDFEVNTFRTSNDTEKKFEGVKLQLERIFNNENKKLITEPKDNQEQENNQNKNHENSIVLIQNLLNTNEEIIEIKPSLLLIESKGDKSCDLESNDVQNLFKSDETVNQTIKNSNSSNEEIKLQINNNTSNSENKSIEKDKIMGYTISEDKCNKKPNSNFINFKIKNVNAANQHQKISKKSNYNVNNYIYSPNKLRKINIIPKSKYRNEKIKNYYTIPHNNYDNSNIEENKNNKENKKTLSKAKTNTKNKPKHSQSIKNENLEIPLVQKFKSEFGNISNYESPICGSNKSVYSNSSEYINNIDKMKVQKRNYYINCENSNVIISLKCENCNHILTIDKEILNKLQNGEFSILENSSNISNKEESSKRAYNTSYQNKNFSDNLLNIKSISSLNKKITNVKNVYNIFNNCNINQTLETIKMPHEHDNTSKNNGNKSKRKNTNKKSIVFLNDKGQKISKTFNEDYSIPKNKLHKNTISATKENKTRNIKTLIKKNSHYLLNSEKTNASQRHRKKNNLNKKRSFSLQCEDNNRLKIMRKNNFTIESDSEDTESIEADPPKIKLLKKKKNFDKNQLSFFNTATIKKRSSSNKKQENKDHSDDNINRLKKGRPINVQQLMGLNKKVTYLDPNCDNKPNKKLFQKNSNSESDKGQDEVEPDVPIKGNKKINLKSIRTRLRNKDSRKFKKSTEIVHDIYNSLFVRKKFLKNPDKFYYNEFKVLFTTGLEEEIKKEALKINIILSKILKLSRFSHLFTFNENDDFVKLRNTSKDNNANQANMKVKVPFMDLD